MQKPDKTDYQWAIFQFQMIAQQNEGSEMPVPKLMYENAMKAVQLLRQEMEAKFGKG